MTQSTSVDSDPQLDAVPSQPRRFILADDDAGLLGQLDQMVRQAGYEVTALATDGQMVVEAARRDRPDLALLDIRMPKMDGLAAAGMLLHNMGIPTIIVSAYSEDEYLDEMEKMGVFGFILKPISRNALRVAIALAWARYRQHLRMTDELAQVKIQLQQRKDIERAKGVLMRQMDIDEEEAMRTLIKMARDGRRRLADMALAILECQPVFQGDPPSKKPSRPQAAE